MDLGVREIGGQYVRVQSRYEDPMVGLTLDPLNTRHLSVRSGRVESEFYAPADVLGEIIGFQADRLTLVLQTSAGLSYRFSILNDGSGTLSFERRGAHQMDTHDLLAESHIYSHDCEKKLKTDH
jgi:hypothetical protein